MDGTTVELEGEAVSEPMREVIELRAACYGWLSAIFKAPATSELLVLFREPAVAGVVVEVAGADVASDLATAADSADLDALRWEYNNLFLVPASQYLTPYESVYRGRHHDAQGKSRLGGLNGPETVEVAAFYRTWEVEVDHDRHLIPDFAGVELDFLRLLAEREAAAWEGGDTAVARRLLDAERTFLLDHATRWLPELCENMAELAGQPLYAALARFARSFLAMEEATFRDIPPLAGEGCPDSEE